MGHVRRHDLRHTFASRLLRRGASLQDVSKLLGHASVKTTERSMPLEKGRWSRVRAIIDPGETAA